MGPYIKFRGTVGIPISANADLITLDICVHQGNTTNNQFFIHGPICENI